MFYLETDAENIPPLETETERGRERKREREKLSLLSRIEVICDKYSQKRGLGVFVDWSRRLKLL